MLWSDSAVKEIKLFGVASYFIDRYRSLQEKFFGQDKKLARKTLCLTTSLGLVSVLANCFAVGYGAVVAFSHDSVGQLAAYITAAGLLSNTVFVAFTSLIGVYHSLLFASNWVQLMDLPKLRITSGRRNMSDMGSVTIRFDKVSFTYPGTDRLVLDNISFTVPANKTTALVGLNGAGKTTIVKLLLRFYELDSGQIYLNDIPISEFSREALYNNFSALFQDFIQYQRTLRENIGYGDLSKLADDAKLLAALDQVGLGGLVKELEAGAGCESAAVNAGAVSGLFDDDYDKNILGYQDSAPDNRKTGSGGSESSGKQVFAQQKTCFSDSGLDTMLGRRFKNGRQLSIGQWQRVGTARALLKAPKVLVLDEPTASVDAISEQHIFQSLAKLKDQLTLLLVAHRFATVAHADHIVVVSGSRIVGEGAHADLLKNCPEYAQLYYSQTGKQS